LVINPEEVDIGPIVREVRRNSRRLDGMNERICSIGLESENTLRTIATFEGHLREFRRNLRDLGLSLMDVRRLAAKRTAFFEGSIRGLEKQFQDVWRSVESMTTVLHHTAAGAALGIDRLQSCIGELSARPFPLVTNASDVVGESADLREAMREKRAQFEGVREAFAKAPEDTAQPFSWREAGKVDVERVAAMLRQKGTSQLDVAVVKQSIEDMQGQVDALEAAVAAVQTEFARLAKDAEKRMEAKIDAVQVESMMRGIAKAKERRREPKKSEEEKAVELPVTPTRPVHSALYQNTFKSDRTQLRKQKKPATARRPRTTVGRLVSDMATKETSRL
jgi:hypothetical protein